MKNTLILTFLLLTSQLFAQQAFQWVVPAGGPDRDVVNGIASQGNDMYITGSYEDKFESGGKEIEAVARKDIYLVRLNGNGKTVWVQNIGGEGDDEADCIAANDENIYLSGTLWGPVNFGKNSFDGDGNAIFASKCSSNGKPEWLARFNYSGHTTMDILECIPGGGILIGGMMQGTMWVGDQELKSTSILRAYTIVLSEDGKPLKAILTSGYGKHRLVAATYDTKGNQYLLFNMTGTVTYEIDGNSCTSESVSRGLFLVKISPESQIEWTQTFSCSDYIEGPNVKVNSEGDVYVVANFSECLAFADTSLMNTGSLETAVISFLENGDLKWAKKIESNVSFKVLDAVVTTSEGLMLTGYFRYQYSVDNIIGTSEAVMGDVFLIQFDNKGNVVWHDEPGEESSGFGKAITLDKSGNTLVAGSFRGEYILNNEELSSAGDQDVFIAKYFNCDQKEVVIAEQPALCPGSTAILKASGGFNTYWWNETINSKFLEIDTPGIYTVEAIDAFGCVATDTIEILQGIVNALSLGNDTTVYEGQEITLIANDGFAKYTWDDGVVGQSRTVAYDADADSAIFNMNATTVDGCESADTVTVKFSEEGFSLASQHNSSCIVYPNPVHEILYWYFELEKPATITARLTDGRSTLVYEKKIDNYIPYSRQEINVKHLASGNYLLTLTIGDVMINEKIVKK